ncbi:hypothetical protein V7S43_008745 [Phytophthora oleae]|uniref:Uncharacterized protein n=1 Tax=Phytophthora oleae TaxID=2107226 RepID=A0ABD3FHP6_9STRA
MASARAASKEVGMSKIDVVTETDAVLTVGGRGTVEAAVKGVAPPFSSPVLTLRWSPVASSMVSGKQDMTSWFVLFVRFDLVQ